MSGAIRDIYDIGETGEMGEPGVVLGVQCGPFDGVLDADRLQRYATATNDPCSAARAGDVVPPVAIVTQIWDAQNEGRRALVPAAVFDRAVSGVHGEHDIVLHRPIVPGEPLRIWVEGHGARPAGRNVAVTLRYLARDGDGALVAEQFWTTVLLGTTCDAVGARAPDHTFPDDARDRLLGTYDVAVDAEMARRYAEASGDWSPHHFDADAARQSGFDRPFIHGLCTMALCAQGVVEVAAGGDPARVRRVAVRFATPVFIGETLHVRVYDAGALGCAFEADSAGATVITHGRAELF